MSQPEDLPLAYLYGQHTYHSDALIVGNRKGLANLRAAIDKALEEPGIQVPAEENIGHGETYSILVELDDSPFGSESWQEYQQPYVGNSWGGCVGEDVLNWGLQSMSKEIELVDALLAQLSDDGHAIRPARPHLWSDTIREAGLMKGSFVCGPENLAVMNLFTFCLWRNVLLAASALTGALKDRMRKY